MNRNVLHLIGSFHIGGTERQAVQLARLLADDGVYRIFIGCLDSAGQLADEASSISSAEIPEYKLSSFYDLNFWSQIRRCMSFIKEREIGIIHTHDFYTNFFGMLAGFLAGVPVRLASKRNTFSKTNKQQLVERQAFRAADKILVNADAVMASLIERGVDASKIVRSFNGVDLERFDKGLSSRSETLSRLGLADCVGKQLITIVANMRSDVKNHRMFLRSAAAITSRSSNAVFVLAGEGELTNSLKDEAAALGLHENVHFLGRCDDVPKLLSVSDVCVLTSRTEGFPNAILEYMAAGKPVVATDVGGASEIIVDGASGYLVPSDDSDVAAERILNLLTNQVLAKRMGRAGRTLVEEKYSLNAQLNQVRDLYDTLLASKRRIGVRQQH